MSVKDWRILASVIPNLEDRDSWPMLRDGQPALRSRRGRRLEGGLLSMRFFPIYSSNHLILRSATWRVSKDGPWVEINGFWYYTNEPMNSASFLSRHRRAHVRFTPKAGDPWMPVTSTGMTGESDDRLNGIRPSLAVADSSQDPSRRPFGPPQDEVNC